MNGLTPEEQARLDRMPDGPVKQALLRILESMECTEKDLVDSDTAKYVERHTPGAVAKFKRDGCCIECGRTAENQRVFPFCSERCSYVWDDRVSTKRNTCSVRPEEPARALKFDIEHIRDRNLPPHEQRAEVADIMAAAIRKRFDAPTADYQTAVVLKAIGEYGMAATIESAQSLLRPGRMNESVFDPWALLEVRARGFRGHEM